MAQVNDSSSDNKPILCLDFDGVCHSYTSGWKGAAVIPDPPVEGMWEFLESATEEFEVHIFSSRSHQEGGKRAMYNWFLGWATTSEHLGIAASLVFPNVKPPAFVSIDDRCLLFTGFWPTIQSLREFKPWNKKDR